MRLGRLCQLTQRSVIAYTQSLHKRSIAQTLIAVTERVGFFVDGGGTTGLVTVGEHTMISTATF